MKRVGLLFAAAIILSVTASGLAAAHPATICALDPRSTLWLSLNLGLHPTAGSAAAFRLADERDRILLLDTAPGLYPTPGSPAEFRVAEQRNLVSIAGACLHS